MEINLRTLTLRLFSPFRFKMMLKLITFCIILVSIIVADEATDIMKKVDDNIRGKKIYIQMSMKISSSHHKRTMKMQSYSQGTKKSFVKIIYPPKDRGITFLSLDNQMWQYGVVT